MEPATLNQLLEQRQVFLGFVRARVEDDATAEDILQSAFMKGVERGGQLASDEKATAWFYRILRNAVVDHYRKRGTQERVAAEWERRWPESADPQAEQQLCACVVKAVERLKPEYASALKAVDVDEQAVNAFAAQAGISAGNAAVRLLRARKALKQAVMQSCGACAEHQCVDCHCRH
jgi:RNA polymerase sigma-70 factor (ECF subfamily)